MTEKRKFPWGWVGCGCFSLVALIVGGLVAAGVFGVQFLKRWEEEVRDPATRQARVEELLGVDELPAPYKPQIFLRVPWLLDMVVISDAEPAEFPEGDTNLKAEHLGSTALLYLSLRDIGDARGDVERVLEGGSQFQGDVELDFHSSEALTRGELELPVRTSAGEEGAAPQRVRWAAHRGEFRSEGRRLDGIYTILVIDCPQPDERVRFGVYWQQAEDLGEENPDYSGTPADEETLRPFLGGFTFCGG